MKTPSLPFFLTEEQWKETAKLSGIPEGADDARHEIEIRIEMEQEKENDREIQCVFNVVKKVT